MNRIVVVLALCSLVFADPWDAQNNPEQLNPGTTQFHYTLKSLPTGGQTANQPWSDTYWPSYQSGVAHRWMVEQQGGDPQDFKYPFYTLANLSAMTSDQISVLSPAEKLDIFNSRYDYPFVKSEWKRTRPDDPTWEGICHGWSPAALFYLQPDAVTLVNADNISVPFGSSDVKALLSYYVGQYDDKMTSQFIGTRCNTDLDAHPDQANVSSCADLNYGAYHVIFSNIVGSQSKGMVVDRERGIQVWNQPVYSFNSTVVYVDAAHASVETVMTYAKETAPAWNKHDAYLYSETYDYTLELDGNGKITGGVVAGFDRVDFAWNDNIDPFYGYFQKLGQIYSASIGGNASMAKARRHPRTLPNHVMLTESAGSFGVEAYEGLRRASWSLAPEHATAIQIDFATFDTERFRDQVRVYEGHHGEGALVAVFHGSDVPESFTVNAPAAYVVFLSDRASMGHAGFEAKYRAL